ncbi:ABC transporter ATP-binding protein [Thermodesulfobacteriota bacterium]
MVEMSQGLQIIRILVTAYPWRTAFVAVCLFLAGVSEGLGIGSVLILLRQVIGQGANGTSTLAKLFDSLFAAMGGTPGAGILLVMILGLIVIKNALILLSAYQVGTTSALVETDYRLALIQSLTKARWSYFISQSAGRLSNAMTTEANQASYCYELICRMTAQCSLVLCYFTIALLASWKLTLIAFAGGGIAVALRMRLVAIAREAGAVQTNSLNTLSASLIDSLGGIKLLKAMGNEERMGTMIQSEIKSLFRARRTQVLSAAVLKAAGEPLFVGLLAIVAYLSIVRWNMELEVLMVLLMVFWRLLLRIDLVQMDYQQVSRVGSAFSSLHAKIKEAESAREVSSGTLEPTLEKGISLRNVSFSYGEKPILVNASMDIPVGSTITVTGPSGVGKTTIADIIMGLSSPESGQVLIDGSSLTDISLKRWRSMLGYAPQETILFHDTVLMNVTLGDPSITEENVRAALEKAGAWEFIKGLPEGIHTTVGERGGKLSGGQRRRLGLARALVTSPKLLILDEVTAELDPATEAGIMETLEQLKGQVTIFIISHQQQFVDISDKVCRLHAGSLRAE